MKKNEMHIRGGRYLKNSCEYGVAILFLKRIRSRKILSIPLYLGMDYWTGSDLELSKW